MSSLDGPLISTLKEMRLVSSCNSCTTKYPTTAAATTKIANKDLDILADLHQQIKTASDGTGNQSSEESILKRK